MAPKHHPTRDRDRREEHWHIFYGDIRVGSIARRDGSSMSASQWEWKLGFAPPDHCANRASGAADSFEEAREAFDIAWRDFLPTCTEQDFAAVRRQRAFTEWKYTMWERGCRLPTQIESGRSTCFCGAALDVAGFTDHVYAAHMTAGESSV